MKALLGTRQLPTNSTPTQSECSLRFKTHSPATHLNRTNNIMKIALLGITGNVGTRLSAELLRRGHEVTGIARNPDKVALQPGLTTKRGDLKNEVELAQLLVGHDAVIHSVMFRSSDPHKVLSAAKAAAAFAGCRRSGKPYGRTRVQLVDTPEFSDVYKAEALAGATFSTSSAPITNGLDLSVAFGLVRSGRAHGQVPPRHGRTLDRHKCESKSQWKISLWH